MLFGEGISREGGLIDLAVERGHIQKSGSWFSYKDERIGQGRDNVRKYLMEHPDLFDELEQKLRAEFTAGNIKVELEEGADDDDPEDEEM
jgi:recombination protein RecA